MENYTIPSLYIQLGTSSSDKLFSKLFISFNRGISPSNTLDSVLPPIVIYIFLITKEHYTISIPINLVNSNACIAVTFTPSKSLISTSIFVISQVVRSCLFSCVLLK